MVNYFSGKFIFEDLITPALKCLPAQPSGEKAIFKSNFVNQAYLHLTRKKKKKKKKVEEPITFAPGLLSPASYKEQVSPPLMCPVEQPHSKAFPASLDQYKEVLKLIYKNKSIQSSSS